MGYNIHMTGCRFGIRAKNVVAALVSVCHAKPAYNQDTITRIIENIENYEYLPDCIRLIKIVRRSWGFELRSEDNDIIGVQWVWEKLTGAEMNWMKAIAPFVPDGCYIEMCGEDGEVWRYVFDGKTVTEKKPKVIWE